VTEIKSALCFSIAQTKNLPVTVLARGAGFTLPYFSQTSVVIVSARGAFLPVVFSAIRAIVPLGAWRYDESTTTVPAISARHTLTE